MLDGVLDNIQEKPAFSNVSTACQNQHCENPVASGFCANCVQQEFDQPLDLDTSVQSINSFIKNHKSLNLTKDEANVL